MNDVKKETVLEIAEVCGILTGREIKSIIYAAYSYSTRINDSNLNDVKSLLAYIDWEYFVKTKEIGGVLPVTMI